MSTNGAIHPSPGQRPGNQVKTYATIGIEGSTIGWQVFRRSSGSFLQTYAVDYDEGYVWD